MEKLYVACEFGTLVSRIMLGTLHNNTLKIGEVRRFQTPIIKGKKSLEWNIPEIFNETLKGLGEIGAEDANLVSISCSSWGADYLLFDSDGTMLSPAFHHEDARSEKGMTEVLAKNSVEKIFEETGIVARKGSTLFQLKAETSRRLKQATVLLPIADAFNHLLGGRMCAEASLASTTQLFSPVTKMWSLRLIVNIGLHPEFMPTIVPAGTKLGNLRPEIAMQAGIESATIVATCSNELAASLAGLPQNLKRDWAYIRIGDESLVGTEVSDPIIRDETRTMGYAHETCLGGATNMYKRTAGLAILEACRSYWIAKDRELCDEVLLHLTTTSPAFESLVDLSDPRFSDLTDMPLKIQAYCRETGQEIPRKPGQIMRCVLESLALEYRKVVHEIELLTGNPFKRLYLLGTENSLLNHFIVDALQIPAMIAPPDVSAIGNVLVQALALGHIKSPEEAQKIHQNSFKVRSITPHPATWDVAAERLREVTAAATQTETTA